MKRRGHEGYNRAAQAGRRVEALGRFEFTRRNYAQGGLPEAPPRSLNQTRLNNKKGKLILTGTRNWTDGLWDIIIPQKQQSINAIIRFDKTKYELAEYLHKCAFSPSLVTFQKAINKGHFITWPGINDINFNKFIKNTLSTAKGHLDQERAKLQSTKQQHNNDNVFWRQSSARDHQLG